MKTTCLSSAYYKKSSKILNDARNKKSKSISFNTSGDSSIEQISNIKYSLLIQDTNSPSENDYKSNKPITNLKKNIPIKYAKINLDNSSKHKINHSFSINTNKLNAPLISLNAKNKLNELYNLNQSLNTLSNQNGSIETPLTTQSNFTTILSTIPYLNSPSIKNVKFNFNNTNSFSNNENIKIKNKKEEIFAALNNSTERDNGGKQSKILNGGIKNNINNDPNLKSSLTNNRIFSKIYTKITTNENKKENISTNKTRLLINQMKTKFTK